ncbi:MAG: hypothetical protein KBT46_01120 [Ruminococcus sp.]|nr:hypothetical protein [Candidatus Copronaster equi]
MFTKEQIKFIRSLGINANFDNLSRKDLFELENAINDELALNGFDDTYKPTPTGQMCESILKELH